MPPLSPDDTTDEIKRRLDIVELISEYLPLKKSGINFSGRCPFHDERTPSFMVSPERQSFKCFGCGKGGDIFTFIMEKEGVAFPTALELLAAKAGVELPERSTTPGAPSADSKVRLYRLLETCQTFWHQLLIKHPKAEAARSYLRQRGVPEAQIDRFKIGLAPPPQTTRTYLAQQGFTQPEQEAAGEPARFADRLIFPIADVTGRPVGFTGRQLPTPNGVTASGPKYWNTPETALFRKSEMLYGLHLAKDAIRKEGVAVLAEGQMDVIGLHSAGLNQSVASSGTALTDRQCQIISRFANEVVFCYDADAAGLQAAERGFEVALRADLNPTVMTLPEGKDPGDLGFRKPELLQRAYENRQPVIAWLLARAIDEYGSSQPTAKKAVVKRLTPWLLRVSDPVERRGWLDIVAERLSTTTSALEDALARYRQPRAATASTPAPPPESPASATESDLLFGLLGWHPTLLSEISPATLKLAAAGIWQPVADWLLAPPEGRPPLPRTDQERLNTAIMTAEKHYTGLRPDEQRAEARRLAAGAARKQAGQRRRQIQTALAAAEAAGDSEEAARLLGELQSVTVALPD